MKTFLIALLFCVSLFAQDTIRYQIDTTVTGSAVLELLLRINVNSMPDTIIIDTSKTILFTEWTNLREPPDTIGAWVLLDSAWLDQVETLFPYPPEDGFLWYHPIIDENVLEWTTIRGWHVTQDSIYHQNSLHGYPYRWVWPWVRYKYKWVIYLVEPAE